MHKLIVLSKFNDLTFLIVSLFQQVSNEDFNVTQIEDCLLPLGPLLSDCFGKDQAVTFINLLQKRNDLTESKS